MPAILFDLVQRLIGVLEDALAEVLAVGKGHQIVRPALQLAGQRFALDVVVGSGFHLGQFPGPADSQRDNHHRQQQRDRDIKDTHTLYSNFFQRQSGFPPEISTELQVILYIVYTSIPKIPPHCNQIALGISSKIVQ